MNTPISLLVAGQSRRDVAAGPRPGVVIAVVAEKGGVGKTTTASNIAAALGRATPARPDGLSVLAIDAEPQGQLALALGAEPDPVREATVADALACAALDRSGSLEPFYDFFGTHPLSATSCENVVLLSGGEAITEARDQINGGGAAGERWMTQATDFLAPHFDAIVIDTPPSVSGPLMLGALYAADLAITPLHANVGWSLTSLDSLVGHVAQLGDDAPPLLPVAQAVDRRSTTWRQIDDVVRAEGSDGYLEHASELVATVVPERRRAGPWLAVVPQSKTIEHGSMRGQPIVVGLRTGSLPGIAMRDLAADAYAIASGLSTVAG